MMDLYAGALRARMEWIMVRRGIARAGKPKSGFSESGNGLLAEKRGSCGIARGGGRLKEVKSYPSENDDEYRK